jgi:hypothetical protein
VQSSDSDTDVSVRTDDDGFPEPSGRTVGDSVGDSDGDAEGEHVARPSMAPSMLSCSSATNGEPPPASAGAEMQSEVAEGEPQMPSAIAEGEPPSRADSSDDDSHEADDVQGAAQRRAESMPSAIIR